MKINIKHLICAVAALFTVAASAQTMPKVYDPGMMIGALSDNGAYAVGATAGDQSVDNPHNAGGVLVTLATHKNTKITAPSGWADVNDVADNGLVVGSEGGKPAVWNPATAAWTRYDVPAQYSGGCFLAVTPDARYAVGYYTYPEGEFYVAPMMYDLTTGKACNIDNLPVVDLNGENKKQNVFYAISPDGRYVLGQMSQSYMMPVSMFSYIYDTANNTWTPIGYNYDAASRKYTPKVDRLHFLSNQFMSCDGNWVCGSAYMVSPDGSEGWYPYRYNVADDKLEIYTDAADEGVAGNKVTADGTLLCCSPMGNPYPTAQIRAGKYFVSLDQVFRQIYNRSVQQLVGDDVSGSFNAITADGLTAVMTTYDNCYIITMPESFGELASRVDLLANYTPDIPEGSKISKISELQITFDRAIGCMNLPSNVKLLDADGNAVRSASGFTVAQGNDHKLVVTFRPYTLTPGQKYTLAIPEGYVWLKGDAAVKAKAINITYTGREEGAVKLLGVTPVDGATIAQLNTSPDYITLTFDSPVAIAENASATLYNADDNTAVATLYGTAEGNRAIFRPASTFQLYKGSDYRVEVAQGSVTDLSGAGGCDAVTLNYHGAYVRELNSDDIYLYNNACNDYDNLIYWKNNINEPAAIPQSWGFTAENIWMLIRDNEESTDQALAAHSMFNPPAESDDWLVTPQIYIPDENAYLAFDAQSFLRSKDDELKVYVYNDNAVYNYFSRELTEKFRADGDLVFDEIIPAGATDNGLDGEWSRYTVPLAKYAGKNIYIAFVNNNYDKSAIFIDNIQVVREMTFLLTNRTPLSVVAADEVAVSGILTVGSEIAEYKEITLTLKDGEGNTIDRIADSNVSLAYGDTYNFTFSKPLRLTPGEESAYVIEVVAGADNASFRYSVKDLMFSTVKKVVLEEFTGSTCANCPLGIRAIEGIEALYPDNFIPITLRAYGGDIYSQGIAGYAQYLGMNAAPSGRIDRGSILMPMLQNGSQGYAMFGRGIVQTDGTEAHLWADEVQDILETPAEASVGFSVDYDAATGTIDVPCTVSFALNAKGRSMSLFAVVVEDKLPTFQQNNFGSISDPLLGEWGKGGMYSAYNVTTWLADDVVRYVLNGNSYNGTVLPMADFAAGEEYTHTISAKIPAGQITNPANCRVVVMLIDGANGRVVNADVAAFGTSGITSVVADGQDAVYYNLQGQRVATPEPGRVYIRVAGGVATKVIAR